MNKKDLQKLWQIEGKLKSIVEVGFSEIVESRGNKGKSLGYLPRTTLEFQVKDSTDVRKIIYHGMIMPDSIGNDIILYLNGSKKLPRFANETPQAYKERLDLSFFTQAEADETKRKIIHDVILNRWYI